MSLRDSRHVGILLLALGGLLFLPALFLGRFPLIGILGLLLLVTGGLLAFSRDPWDDTWLFP